MAAGKRIREARIAQGLSQAEVAERMGLEGANAAASVSRWERGKVHPSWHRLVDLARVLGVRPTDLDPRARPPTVVDLVGAGLRMDASPASAPTEERSVPAIEAGDLPRSAPPRFETVIDMLTAAEKPLPLRIVEAVERGDRERICELVGPQVRQLAAEQGLNAVTGWISKLLLMTQGRREE